MIQALIFDYDGVVVLSEQPRFRVLRTQAAKFGVVIRDDAFAQMLGKPTRVFFDKVLPDINSRTRQNIIDAYEIEFKGNITDHVAVVEPVIGFIKNYTGSVPLALASMSDYAVIERVLKHIDIYDAFKVIIGKDTVKRHKPDPEIYLTAAERLGVQPSLCAAVEDTPVGAEAALRAGMTAYALLNGFNNENDFAGLAVRFVRSPEDIRGILM